MKKALLFAVSIVFVVMVFSGCKDAVTVNSYAPPQVASVSVVLTDDDDWAIVSWEAVEGASGYAVYYKVEGAKNVTSTYHSGQYKSVYDPDGSSDDNEDYDQWSAKISRTDFLNGAKIIFGVQTKNYRSGGQYVDSDIKWSEDVVKVE
jgi:hypothetical protein